MNTQTFWVYILLCENGHYYTGYTTDLERRFREHVQGSYKCKYTRAFKPIKIVQAWQMPNRSSAMRLEIVIKRMSHTEKKNIIAMPTLIPQITHY